MTLTLSNSHSRTKEMKRKKRKDVVYREIRPMGNLFEEHPYPFLSVLLLKIVDPFLHLR